MIGVRSSSYLPVVARKVQSKSLFVSRVSFEVTTSDIEKYLRKESKFASLVCTGMKTKYDSCASFHVSVSEDGFPVINNIGLWPDDCLIALCGLLSADQIEVKL
jgi:hypothetical protein